MEERVRYIYEITNKLNGKTYIGQHTLREGRTLKTDLYYGSGVLIKRAQKKYGLENFEKKIIIYGNFSKVQINKFERCFIFIQKLLNKAEYNIASGGDGGIDYFWKNATEEQHKHLSEIVKQAHKDHPERYINAPIIGAKRLKEKLESGEIRRDGKYNSMFGKKHSDESKHKMSESHLGDKNSQFGTHWYTNGVVNIKAKECPIGFRKGRI